MASRGAAALAARWLAVVAVLAGPALAAHAAAAPSPSSVAVTIETAPPAVPAQIRYGFDIKQWGKSDQLDHDLARARFGPGGHFSVLRIPIYAGDERADAGQPDADPKHINAGLYAPVVAAVHEAIRANPSTLIYANVKTPYNGASMYARWLRGADLPDHYARLLFNYVAYMQSRDVPINAIGILNEVAPDDLGPYDGGRLPYDVA